MAGMGPADSWNVGERDTVINALDRAVARHPDRVLLDFGGTLSTYRDVDRLSTCMAHALHELGLRAGQTLVSMLDNNLDAVLVWLAALTSSPSCSMAKSVMPTVTTEPLSWAHSWVSR